MSRLTVNPQLLLSTDELLVIVEYCRYGSIHSHLQKNRDCFINDMTPSTGEISIDVGNKVNGYVQHKRYTFSKWDLLHWAWQVSRGMEHLSFKKVSENDSFFIFTYSSMSLTRLEGM